MLAEVLTRVQNLTDVPVQAEPFSLEFLDRQGSPPIPDDPVDPPPADDPSIAPADPVPVAPDAHPAPDLAVAPPLAIAESDSDTSSSTQVPLADASDAVLPSPDPAQNTGVPT